MGYNQDKILNALQDKRINYLKKSYLELEKILTNNQISSIRKKIKSTTPNGFRELLVSYFIKYNIKYKEAPTRTRTPEDKEDLKKRQKKYIQKQKDKNKKLIQIYIDSHTYELLLNMKKTTKKSFSFIVSNSLSTQARVFTTWTD